MPAPPVYLDACVDVRLATSLAQRGFTATIAHAQQMAGADDEAQLQFAAQRGWTMLSHNNRGAVGIHGYWSDCR
jgi:hypothetical protein